MPKFGDVFSTTWKVLLALFLISLGVGVIYLVLGAIGNSSSRSGIGGDDWTRQYHQKNADDASSKMPKSQWDRQIKQCIKERTVIEGMSKEEVKQTVGGDEPWTYSIITLKSTDQKCIRYSGEQCAEYPPDEVKTFNLHFSPNGHLIWDEDSIGLSVYDKIKPKN
jgi:hypothetical protein